MKKKTSVKIIDRIILLGLIIGFLFIIISPKKLTPATNLNVKGISNPREVRRDKKLVKIAIEPISSPLNPFFESTQETSLISRLLHRSLYRVDKAGEILPDLAKNYWYEDGGKTLAITLKKGSKFPDGRELVADDLYKNIKLLSDPDYSGPKSYYVENIGGYYSYKLDGDKEGLEVYPDGKYFIKIKFNKLSKDNLRILEMPIVQIDDEDLNYGRVDSLRDKDFHQGNGFYRVQDYSNERILLTKKDEEGDFPKEIAIFQLSDHQALKAISRGDIDMALDYSRGNDNMYYKADQIPYVDKYTYQDKNFLMLGFNYDKKLLRDNSFRRLIRDRIDFVDIFNLKAPEIIESPVYRESHSYIAKEKDVPSDTAALLESVKGKRLNLAVYKNQEEIGGAEKKLKEEFDKLGIEINIIQLNESDYFKLVDGDHDYDLFILEGQLFKEPSLDNQHIYSKDGEISKNYPKDLDNINRIKWISKILGVENYSFALKDWQEWYYDKVPYIPIKSDYKISLVNTSIKGLDLNRFMGIDNPRNLKKLNIY